MAVSSSTRSHGATHLSDRRVGTPPLIREVISQFSCVYSVIWLSRKSVETRWWWGGSQYVDVSNLWSTFLHWISKVTRVARDRVEPSKTLTVLHKTVWYKIKRTEEIMWPISLNSHKKRMFFFTFLFVNLFVFCITKIVFPFRKNGGN